MTIFGIGPGELLLIAALTLVVVGPERLPGLARRLGQTLVTVRNWIQRSPDAMMVLRLRQELENELSVLRSSLAEVQNVRDEVMNAARHVGETVESEVLKPVRDTVNELNSVGRAQTRSEAFNSQSVSEPQPTADPERPLFAGDDPDPPAPEPAEATIAPDVIEPAEATIAPPTAEPVEATITPDVIEPSLAPQVVAPVETLDVPQPASAPVTSTEFERLSARLDALATEMRDLQASLMRQGLIAPQTEEHVPASEEQHDVND